MNHFHQILRLLALYSLQSSIFAGHSFVFNPVTLQHYDQQSTIEATVKSGPFAAACPASGENQLEFNNNNSLDQKALFVTNYEYFQTGYRDLSTRYCNNNYELAVVYHSSNGIKTMEFGYETVEARHKLIRFLTKLARPSLLEIRSNEEIRYVDLFAEIVEKVYRKLGFVWIPKIITLYHKSSWSVEKVTYRMHRKTNQMLVTCDNHDLAIEMHEEGLIKFYTPEHQNIIFQSFKLSESPRSACKSTSECVEKYNLVSPAYYFQASPFGPVSCSNLTTIPVWSNTTKSLLEYLDKFLVAITETWDFYPSGFQQNENIIPGVLH